MKLIVVANDYNRTKMAQLEPKVIDLFRMIEREAVMLRFCPTLMPGQSIPDPTADLSDELLRLLVLSITDKDGNTALHHVGAVRTVKALLHGLDPDVKQKVICKSNKKNQSILHVAAERGEELTTPHFCTDPEFTTFLDDLLKSDIDGNTPLHLAIEKKQWKSVTDILEALASNRQRLTYVLTHKNKMDQNVFHLSAMHFGRKDHDILLQYRDCVDLKDMTSTDKEGNTAMHHLALTQNIKYFGDYVMNLPWDTRRDQLLSVISRPGLTCIDILSSWLAADRVSILKLYRYGWENNDLTYGLQFEYGKSSDGPRRLIRFDPDVHLRMRRLLNYSRYCFSLTDTASKAFLATGEEQVGSKDMNDRNSPCEPSSVTIDFLTRLDLFTKKLGP